MNRALSRAVNQRLVPLFALIVMFGLGIASSAHADRAFELRFSTNDTGSIKGIANTLMTCPASDDDCSRAQNVSPTTTGGRDHNNHFDMTYVDVDSDSSTFNSSTANLSVPAGSDILFAGLYWGGDRSGSGSRAAPDPEARDKAKFKLPGSNSYLKLTADKLDDSSHNKYRYQAFKDVTGLLAPLANSGSGTYAVANVQAGKGSDHYAGWNLVVVYRNTAEPARNLTVFDGLKTILAHNPPTNIPFSGFLTPPAGPVATELGFVAWEGDQTLVGDTTSLNGHTLSDAQHPATNFFDSRISHGGVLYTDRNPAYPNALGIDAVWTNANGMVPNSATSATLRVTTSGDYYLPGVITFQTLIYAPKIEQEKTVTDENGGAVEQGDILTYRVTGKNVGQDGTSNFEVRDPIPANTTYLPGSIDLSVNSAGPTGSQTDAAGDDLGEYDATNHWVRARFGQGATAATGGNVRPGDSYELTFRVRVNGPDADPIVPGTAIENEATAGFLSKTTGTPLTAVSRVKVVAEAPDLRITKTRTGPDFVAGGTSEYTFAVDNHGSAGTQGTVTVTDPLPAGITATAVDAPGWSCNPLPATSLSCSRNDALAPGGSYPPIVLTVALDETIADEVANTGTVSGGGDAELGDNSSTSTNPSSRKADLGITKTASKDRVGTGETFGFDLTVTNHGPSKATSVAITDPLPDGLSFVSATPPPGCVAQPTSGVLACAIGDLASGASHTVRLTVKADLDASGTLANTASVAGRQSDPNPGNNSDTATVEVIGADLGVVKRLVSPAKPATGDLVTYELTVTNHGPSPATGVMLHDALPAGLSSVGSHSTECSVGAGAVDCPLGDLPVGGSFTVEITGTVEPGLTELINRAAVTGVEDDPDPSNNQDEVTTPVGHVADLSIVKDADEATTTPGGDLAYTFTVRNDGPDAATGIEVTDVLPDGLAWVGGDAGCGASGQTVTCSIASLAPGGQAQVSIAVKVTDDAAGELVNAASVEADLPDPDPSNNRDEVVTPVIGEADVAIEKTVDDPSPFPGDRVTFTLTAENLGTAVARNVVVTDTLPSGLSFVSADAPCVESDGDITCAVGDLGPGQKVTLEVEVAVDAYTTASPNSEHLLDVQKVEAQVDLDPGQTRTTSVTCPGGYFASDGSVRIDQIDQGTGDWTAAQVLESRADSLGSWQGTVRNTASGRAQAKVFAVCVKQQTAANDGHAHGLVVSDPVTVTKTVFAAGDKRAVLKCGPNQVAIQPGFIADGPGRLVYSQPKGTGWKFVFSADEVADVTFSIRCMDRQVSFEDGHSHNLMLERIWTEVEVQPGKVNEVQLICSDGAKGIVGGWDLDPGLVSLGNDPRPVTRAFKLYNPTGEPLTARLSLLCLGDRTTGELSGPGDLFNTAQISTSSGEENTDNNSSTATVAVQGSSTPPPVGNGPGKPAVNNPVGDKVAGTPVVPRVVGGVVRQKKNRHVAWVTCAAACSGKLKLVTSRRFKLNGKKIAKGSVLARGDFNLDRAGKVKVRLKPTGICRKLVKNGSKINRAVAGFSSGHRQPVRIKR